MVRRSALLFVFVTTIATAASAQDRAASAMAQGGISLTGSIAFSTAGGDLYGNDRVQTLSFGPGIGYFVADGITIGGVADAVLLSQSGDTYYTLAVGPELAAYIGRQSTILPTVRGSVLVLNTGNQHSSETGFGFKLSTGIAVLASGSVGIAMDVSFLWERYKPSGYSQAITGNTVLFGVSLVGFIH